MRLQEGMSMRSQTASSQTAASTKAQPDGRRAHILDPADGGSRSSVTRSASFSIAVLSSSTTMHQEHACDQREPLPVSPAIRKASGTASTKQRSFLAEGGFAVQRRSQPAHRVDGRLQNAVASRIPAVGAERVSETAAGWIRTELERGLHEHAHMLGLPVDRLRGGGTPTTLFSKWVWPWLSIRQ